MQLPSAFAIAPELREAAEKTLDWTRWDERYYAQLRAFGLKNSSEREKWLEELVRKHRERGVLQSRLRFQSRPYEQTG